MRHRTFTRTFLFSCTVLISEPVLIAAAVVTLNSIEIFKIHEWIDPTIFFQCKGEIKTVLPDVKEKNVVYTFKGVESWQHPTELPDMKCTRCEVYEKNVLRAEDEFDEWELCASDFISSDGDGRYIHFKDKGFNATFIYPECPHIAKDAKESADERTRSLPMHSSAWTLSFDGAK